LMENPHVYEELAAKGDYLRSTFNSYARANGLEATMTGIGSMFQTHLKAPPVERPRDMMGQPAGALADLQLVLRLNGVFIPWLHLAFLSAAHSEADVEAVLQAHQVSVETCLERGS
jgi:glutamate-1-semialdehyde aminotransferase